MPQSTTSCIITTLLTGEVRDVDATIVRTVHVQRVETMCVRQFAYGAFAVRMQYLAA